jgi:type I restriction enzyme S subunit
MWTTEMLSSVVNISPGNSIPAKKKSELFTGVKGMPYVATKDVSFDGIINYDNEICIPQDYLNNFRVSPKYATLICAEGGSAGRKIAFSHNECCYVNKLFSLQPTNKIIPKFLYYYSISAEFQLQFKAALHGLIGGVSLTKMKKFAISYPSIPEQERIVAKLDAAFAEIDEAVAVTTKNIETVEFLFQKSLDKIFCNPSSKFIELDEACSIIGGGTPSKKNKSFYVGKVPWATVRDMKSDYISNTEFKITNDAIKKSSTNVIPSGNVVIATRVGLGKICIVEEDTAINQDLKGIIPKNTELLDTDFLFFWFKSISKKIINAGTGATVQGVKLPFIKSLKIPDIDITSQKKLASSAKFISKQSELLARIYNKKSNDLAVLKAAILKQELQPSEAA